jgi:transposase
VLDDYPKKHGDFSLGGVSKENVHPKRRSEINLLRGSDLKTARALAIKENLRHLWSFRAEGWARRLFSQWSSWPLRSRLDPIKAVASMIDRCLDNIITFCRHRLTNVVAEGFNSKIMAIKRRDRGYRNVANFKNVIYFYCGGLQLYP